MSGVELGFLQECAPWQVESRLFPSKVGGKPAWLDLDNLPTPERLQCKNCQQTMVFLCQIYAPYEGVNESTQDCYNFHRTLFVFICRNPKCCQRNSSDNIKVFRSSLPRANKFYGYDPPQDKPDPEFSLNKLISLCNLCGCMAEKQCSKCKNVYYCSREHQILDWKEGHKRECCELPRDRLSKLLFSQWEIITEPEEEIEDKVISEEEELQKFNQLKQEGKIGTMCNVPESDLNDHASADQDKSFTKFKKRISYDPNQVIRYQKGGSPLWIASEPLPEGIPDCNFCCGPRRFEFQIMPQLLTMLKENELDWGVIAVYTCVNSCADTVNYKEEFVFKQDVELKTI
ncbi:hypothetical protein NQ315_003904 [Exocentrus adspersus]|uniref:MYND-type domain-containing protein n=1 Tax=Exocentrus adspersus TaxID=1586481 RepID=A0AAV8VYW0_9CUCU|nr:hypothetical protein NQ315_003904 [Exocentrus adspersus]